MGRLLFFLGVSVAKWVWIVLVVQPLLYWQGLWGDFVFDDRFLIVETMNDLSLSNIWFGGLWGESENQANFYRPLFSMTIWLDQQLFGLNPFGYHLHSLLWHGLNIVLFAGWVAKFLSPSEQKVAVCIFACHPMMSELVFWIAARNDTMALTAVLAFLGVFWEGGTSRSGRNFSWPDRLLCLLFLLVGLLSKESTLILVVPVLYFAPRHKDTWLIGSFFGVVAMVFGWRLYLGIATPSLEQANIRLFQEHLVAIFLDGYGRLFFPWRLSPSMPMEWLSLSWWQQIFGVLTLVLAMVAGRRIQDDFMWSVWMLVGVGLAIPAMVYTGNFGDRYWSLALVGWAVIVARCAPLRFAWVPLPFWCVMIFLRGGAWTSDENFWSQEVSQYKTPYSQVSLAIIQYNQGDLESAMHNFYQGFATEPPHIDGCVPFVSSVLSVQGKLSALEASDWAIERGCPVDGTMIGLRAVILAGLGRWDEVEEILAGDWIDSSRRLDVVRMVWWAKSENWLAFCTALETDTWQNKENLYRQLKILSPLQFENTDWIVEQCTGRRSP